MKTTTKTHARFITPKNKSIEAQRMAEAVRECLSPHAVALLATYARMAAGDADLHAFDDDCEVATKQAKWFADLLAETVGGWDSQAQLAAEIGI